ncbi:ribonuclease P protein component 1 [Haloarcula salinisoli]|uniref:Ribonuclease P protein component 1 n=1 Tax=Haloarcula salinisoli TaxID=2487746 RepID=A0A8J7YG92_9EURY|nr:ribonuclease P protein component 1 [Halomicroarcula salinisoli]MBX0287491.1 ribonuclease P protein component 1 [Halomicroarcula salinisoli]MBX0304937.1 ribonuclease P protein component 1 [Halomicroarcula salinisoli]
MPLTPETLTRHELVGLDVEVVAASNPDAIGISGSVVMETTQLLTVERDTRVWHVPKDSATFAFDLDGQTVRVEGERLVDRPARRTANAGDSKWR